jgi:ribonuclease Z
MKTSRFLTLAGVVLATSVLGLYAFRAPVSVWLAKRLVTQKLAVDVKAELPDGLHVGLCGAGSPFPDDRRGGPCTVVLAGQKLFVFDAGNASARNLGKMGFNHGQIDAIFLTHFHSDHIDGLGELMLQRWVNGAHPQAVPVYGPPGVQKVVGGLNEAYAQDQHYRVAHHGEATLPSAGAGGLAQPFEATLPQGLVVLRDAGVEVMAFPVDHAPVHPAVGYRISYKGRTVVLSGDTRPSKTVAQQAQGVDLLVHEALSSPLVQLIGDAASKAGRPHVQKLMSDIVDYHSSPEQAAQIAQDAKVGYLLLSHIAPPLPIPGMEKAFLGDAAHIYSGPLRAGVDGDFISLPAASKEIRVGRRF